jgi:predicted dehydrogenase
MVNENFRWQPWHRLVRQILVEGLLGRPFLTTMRQRSRLTLPEFKHYQRYFAEMPHLLLTEVGVHLLDVHRFLFGEPETVYARLHRLSPHVRGEDVQVLILGYPGMTSLIVDSWASVPIPGRDRPDVSWKWFPRVLEIDGTEGTLILQPDGAVRLFTDADQRTWDAPEDGMQQAHSAALQHFIDCLESGAEFETSGRETLKTLELMYVGYQSAEQGRPVSPAELLALP